MESFGNLRKLSRIELDGSYATEAMLGKPYTLPLLVLAGGNLETLRHQRTGCARNPGQLRSSISMRDASQEVARVVAQEDRCCSREHVLAAVQIWARQPELDQIVGNKVTGTFDGPACLSIGVQNVVREPIVQHLPQGRFPHVKIASIGCHQYMEKLLDRHPKMVSGSRKSTTVPEV